jgi:S1-C subfamily serine protease
LDLKISHNNAASISEATKAVVTVKTRNGYGSGCILNSEGYIITCYHVTGDVDSTIEIITEAGMKLKASLIRYNPKYDLALLKAEGTFSDALNIDSSKTFELGTEIYAIGTPGEIELGQSLSKGIISGKRKISDRIYIQTDVSINKGNSGGALIDKNGSLIGIVNAKIVGLGVEGIGFAIPVTYIEEALKIKLR